VKKYYSLAKENNEASINIYGDITSWEWLDSDVSSYTLAKEIEFLDVDVINVYINSYGGEVAEGLAIYNQLKRHKATIKTYDDGFACSAASLVFMAGDERIMSNSSLLMIHNAWMYTAGNAKELRKQADDIEIISTAAANAYMNVVNITREELDAMLDAESWIAPADALEMGFATSIVNDSTNKNPNQSIKKHLSEMILVFKNAQKEIEPVPVTKQTLEPTPEPTPAPVETPKESFVSRFINQTIKEEEK